MYYCIFVVVIPIHNLEKDQVSAFKNKYWVGQDVISTADSLSFLALSIVSNLQYIIVFLSLIFSYAIWRRSSFLEINIDLMKKQLLQRIVCLCSLVISIVSNLQYIGVFSLLMIQLLVIGMEKFRHGDY